MAVLDRDEYLKRLSSIIVGDTDEDLKNIEDFTDTFDDLLGKADTENWKQKYEDNDADWRKKYKDRFFEVIDETKVKEIDTPGENTDELESEPKEEVKEYDDLFEEKED